MVPLVTLTLLEPEADAYTPPPWARPVEDVRATSAVTVTLVRGITPLLAET